MTTLPKAIILLSGGLDSATCLAIARHEGFEPVALSFDYGQRHNAELVASRRVAEAFAVRDHRVLRLELGTMGGSALTDSSIDIPTEASEGIPVTYVPARNTVFLS
ncbi:MAG: 7-cyano-7-deazaguanine synthase, partial [Moraxellaceae bacterium]|nr:7-cyano-7-deazaguanine synthase [Moraxellaceae bacterium]